VIWYVAAGSAAGGVARFLLSGVMQRASSSSGFPFWTLVVNVTGSLLLGFLMRYFVDGVPVSPEVRAMLTTGFCGGYTTFSTFSYETAVLLEQGDIRRGTLYVLLSVMLSLLGAIAGIAMAREFLALRRGG
jgi:CrcB protein